MGFLLLQYEYQRANNQYNLCERTGIRLNNKVTTYTKRVEKMQNLFTKAQSKLENEWTNKTNQMNTMAQSASAMAQTGGSFESFIGNLGGIIIGNTPITSIIDLSSYNPGSGATATQVASAIQAACGQVAQAISTITAAYKEADLAQLQEQQDEQLQPIAEKETEYENEKNTNEALTTLWEQRRDNAKSRLEKDIPNGVAKYGIGQ